MIGVFLSFIGLPDRLKIPIKALGNSPSAPIDKDFLAIQPIFHSISKTKKPAQIHKL
jgi:hypothetical protein